jgi:hypothetical protein
LNKFWSALTNLISGHFSLISKKSIEWLEICLFFEQLKIDTVQTIPNFIYFCEVWLRHNLNFQVLIDGLNTSSRIFHCLEILHVLFHILPIIIISCLIVNQLVVGIQSILFLTMQLFVQVDLEHLFLKLKFEFCPSAFIVCQVFLWKFILLIQFFAFFLF